MQASRSLFQTSIKLQARTAPSGISRSRPFLNLWRGETPEQQQQQQQRYQRTGNMASATTFFDFAPKDKTGSPHPLSQYRSRVVLVVNTASKCGFTPQLTSLQSLHKSLTTRYPDDFTLLAFPCNQFNSQDPGTDDEIQSFCQRNYGVDFEVLAKTDVNGDGAEDVWKWMKAEKPGLMGYKGVKWNFEKFLIGRDGKVKGRWASTTKPESLEKVIVEEIEKGKVPVGESL